MFIFYIPFLICLIMPYVECIMLRSINAQILVWSIIIWAFTSLTRLNYRFKVQMRAELYDLRNLFELGTRKNVPHITGTWKNPLFIYHGNFFIFYQIRPDKQNILLFRFFKGVLEKFNILSFFKKSLDHLSGFWYSTPL